MCQVGVSVGSPGVHKKARCGGGGGDDSTTKK